MDSDDPKICHIELNRSQRAILKSLWGWVSLGKVLGVIFIVVGSVTAALENENRFFGAVAGFVVCSVAVATIQLFLLGLPYGFFGGAPCGAVVGVVLVFFRPATLYEYIWFDVPKWWPNQLLLGAAFGALAGAVLVSGFAGYWLIDIEGVGWWPLSVYKLAFDRLRNFATQFRFRSNSKQEDLSTEINLNSEEGEEAYETLGPSQELEGAPNPTSSQDC